MQIKNFSFITLNRKGRTGWENENMKKICWTGVSEVLLVIIGWLVGWSVGNSVFSETALRIFLIFCIKLGDYKGRKVTEPDF